MKKKHNRKILKEVFKNYLLDNLKEYAIITVFFLIGIFLGIVFINNSNEYQKDEINTYITSYIQNVKDNKMNKIDILKNDIKENTILFFILWFSGTTIIGIPIVVATIAYKGFCLGYTISACSFALGSGKAIGFTLSAIFVHNIIAIPILITIGVSGIKLYKTIVKNKKKDNIKTAVIKHTILCVILLIVIIFTSFIKVFISGGLLECFAKYFVNE